MSERRWNESTVGEVEDLGLSAAAAVVERIMELTRGADELRIPFAPATASNAEARRLRADAERLIDQQAEWLKTLLDTALAAATNGVGAIGSMARGDRGATSSDVASGRSLIVVGAAAGTTASTEVWLHLLDGPAAEGTFWATDLVTHDGSRIAGTSVVFEPSLIEAAHQRRSLPVVVSIPTTPETAPGIYRGHILARGLPEVSLEIEVEIEPVPRRSTTGT